MSKPTVIRKKLSINDVGSNGSHQAGMLIPKRKEILGFFPELDSTVKNPRCSLPFTDGSGHVWRFNFIYYNNKLIEPNGTRNEYRLTGMTPYIRENNLKSEDEIELSRSEDGSYHIRYVRSEDTSEKNNTDIEQSGFCITLSHNWKVINL